MERHKIKNIKQDIYYEYISVDKLDIVYHLVSIDSDNINFIIPTSYHINYSQSDNTYDHKGHIYFYDDKNSYSLDYTKREYDSFKAHMKHKENNILKQFSNYRNQEFYEVLKNNEEYIYMYFNGYYFKISINHKMSINEYYNMYLILLSISNDKIEKNVNLLKELYYFDVNSLYSICNNIDLINKNLSNFVSDIVFNEDNIIVSNDQEYIKYKSKQNKIDIISKNLLSNVFDTEDIKVEDTFRFANLGTYNVIIKDYNEIIDSDELTEEDKNTLICKMIEQKQNEAYSNKDKINEEFYQYIIEYLKKNLTYSLWDNYHIREFINMDKFDDELTDQELYDTFMNDINLDNVLNLQLVEDSIKCHELSVYPNKYVLRLSIFNGLLNSLKIIFDEEYNLLDLNK